MTTRALFALTENPTSREVVRLVISKRDRAVELDFDDICELVRRLSPSLLYVCKAGVFAVGRAYHASDPKIGTEGWAG